MLHERLLAQIKNLSLICLILSFAANVAYATDKNFVILTASYNNSNFYKRNLDSIFGQTYPHWELVYIDDMSTDGTGESVKAYIKEKGFEHKVKFVANTEKCYCLKNYYREIHQIADDKIVVTVDGDDGFLDNTVLEYLNEIYQDPNVWCTYGNYKDVPARPAKSQFILKPFSRAVIEQNKFREVPWNIHHLRSFYAALFKNIKLEDCLYEGKFIEVAEDVAFMMPIIEQCGRHHRFIEKQLYLYNTGNPLQAINVWKVNKIKTISDFIYRKTKYQPLTVPPYLTRPTRHYRADLIVFNSHGPQQLRSCLEGINRYVSDIATIFVVLNNHTSLEGFYKDIIHDFPHIKFVEEQSQTDPLCTFLEREAQPYIVLFSDLAIPNRPISLNKCIDQLNCTGAYAFFLNTYKAAWEALERKNVLLNLTSNVSATQFKQNKELLYQAKFMNLYRTNEVKKCTQKVCQTFLDLKTYIPEIVDPEKVGLVYKPEEGAE